jgi:hypothetical protein
MKDLVISGGGDAVVGQEYTDFDKGLDDGIEGEVFGFNLLTSKPNVRHDSSIVSWFKTQENAFVLPQPHYVVDSAKAPIWNLRPLQGLRTTFRGLVSDKLVRWPEDTRSSGKVSKHNPTASIVRWPDSHETRRAPRTRTREKRDASVELNPGLELVEKSYRQCTARRGSPVDDSRLLIAWASTPVRVFGGAVITAAKPVCGHF